MSWASTAPAAISGLVAAWQSAADLAGVQVIDGPRVSGATLREVITVGWTGEDATEAISGAFSSGGLALAPDREKYTVNCAAAAVRDTKALAAARERAYELLSAAAGALAADKTLGGAVVAARLGEVSLTQAQDTRGAVATLIFGVDIDAFTRT